MRNLKDQGTKIFPSTTRGGKELPSSSALDSPSILSKLATPTPAIDFDMSHVIDDATSCGTPAQRKLERPVFQPRNRDEVFWNTALLSIEQTSFLLLHEMNTRSPILQ